MTQMIRESPDGPLLYAPMIQYMNDIMTKKRQRVKVVDNIFRSDILAFANKSIKSGNYYILDRYNLVIRKLEQNKAKSAYGWVYDSEGYPINIHINKMLLDTNSDNITIVTLQLLKNKFPTIFKPPRGQLWKIYSKLQLDDVDIENV